MFQTFDDTGGAHHGRERLRLLRAELRKARLAAFIVPRGDAHQGEYVPPSEERMTWLTGFSGSAGTAVVARRSAGLFVDGRYTLQAQKQIDTALFSAHNIADLTAADWIGNTLKRGDRLGFDPWLHTPDQVKRLRAACEAKGAKLEAVKRNPIDAIWTDRPDPPLGAVKVHPLKLAGRAPGDKLGDIRKTLKAADAVVLTQPDSIAWLFNIRGGDLPHVPVALCFAIVPVRGKPQLFIDRRKLNSETTAYLKPFAVLKKPDELIDALKSLGKKKTTVQIDPASCAFAIADVLERARATIVHGRDPCLLPKARKTKAELSGARSAQLRDAIAVARFLAWLDRKAYMGKLTEIAAAQKLESFRTETGKLQDLSFDTISGAGANGAIVHYRVTEASNAKLKRGSLYLVDSGAQYHDGTTDITRTIAIGTPTAEMRRRFTLVLKGHIAIARARFPKGTTGAQLDALARAPLWREGLDYDHGTGHGVGSYLSVHEGPQGISRRAGGVALEPGMILSNEPGYYRDGKYGIRIENLVVVRPVRGRFERETYEFETLTLAPIDQRLIEPALLDDDECQWLDAYHARVREALAPELQAEDRGWLEQATMALKRTGSH